MTEAQGYMTGIYWLVGLIVTISLVRHVNRGLSLVDIFCAAVVAWIWPVTAAILLIASVAYKAPWITEPRYFRKD